MDRIRCTFVRLADGLEVSSWAHAGRLGTATARAFDHAGQALDCTMPGVELEVIACQENEEPWVHFPKGWSTPRINDLERARRSGTGLAKDWFSNASTPALLYFPEAQ